MKNIIETKIINIFIQYTQIFVSIILNEFYKTFLRCDSLAEGSYSQIPDKRLLSQVNLFDDSQLSKVSSFR